MHYYPFHLKKRPEKRACFKKKIWNQDSFRERKYG